MAPADAGGMPPLPRRTWWQRTRARFRRRRKGEAAEPGDDGRTGVERAAYQAYRRGLDLRYRVMRMVAFVAVVGFAALSLGVGPVNFNPRTWIRDGYHRLRGDTYVQVDGLKAAATDELPEGLAAFAVDGQPDRAWTTTWTQPSTPIVPCQDRAPVTATTGAGGTGAAAAPPAGAAGTLAVHLGAAVDIARIRILAGLTADDTGRRSTEWTPTILEIRDSTGGCRAVPLADTDHEQTIKLSVKGVTDLAVTVVGADPPLSPGGDHVSIREIRVDTKR
jgi:hypothetical protein